jgi:hypothetical protein
VPATSIAIARDGQNAVSGALAALETVRWVFVACSSLMPYMTVFRQVGTIMKRIIAGVALVMNTASFSSADAVCIYADRQYSEGATLCISPTATQTCMSSGSWTKLELPQTQPNACERAFQTPNSVTLTVSPERRRENEVSARSP